MGSFIHRVALNLVALALCAAPAMAEGMLFKPTELAGWALHQSGKGHYFYLCVKPWCSVGSTVSVALHPGKPSSLDGSEAAIRSTILRANAGKITDVTFGPVKSGTAKGLLASYRTYHITIAPTAIVTDAPYTQYGFVADLAAPLTVSIVSSSSSAELAAKNFAVFVDQTVQPLLKGRK